MKSGGVFDWVCAVAVIIGTFIIVYVIDTAHIVHDQRPTTVTNNEWSTFLTEPTAVFTAVIALFTVLLCWGTWCLVWGADKTSKRQLRAYIAIDDAHYDSSEGCLFLRIKNFGLTPANSVIIQTDHKISGPVAAGAKFWSIKNQEDHPAISLPPTKSITLRLPVKKPVNWPTMPFGQVQGSVLYVNGKIDYIDSFNDLRFVEFRLEHPWINNDFSLGLSRDGNKSN